MKYNEARARRCQGIESYATLSRIKEACADARRARCRWHALFLIEDDYTRSDILSDDMSSMII